MRASGKAIIYNRKGTQNGVSEWRRNHHRPQWTDILQSDGGRVTLLPATKGKEMGVEKCIRNKEIPSKICAYS